MYRRQEKTLLKKQEKQVTEANAKAYHLHAKHFKCEPDALAAAAALAAKWPLLEASEPEVSARTVNTPGRKSRPKAG
jgi:transposase